MSLPLCTTKLSIGSGIFQLLSLDISSASSSATPLDSSYLKSLRGGGQSIYVRSLSVLGDARRVPFFSLPASHTGNQVKSYGGYLRFQLTYRGEGAPISGPLVILQVSSALRDDILYNLETMLYRCRYISTDVEAIA
jgi:hypothetical protein